MKKTVPLVVAMAAASILADVIAPPRNPPPRREPSVPVMPPTVSTPRLAADEKPPEIASYSVEARVNGAFASVRAFMVISNPNGRAIEGNLEFPLPDGASVCGYALDVNGSMTDGVVVKKEKARVAFEKEVKKGVDPGIAEHVKANAWRTRVYPISARGSRRVRLDYVAPLAFAPNGDAALVLAMPRTKLRERAVSITVPMGGGTPKPVLGGLGDNRFAEAEAVWRTMVCDKDIVPSEDVVVAMPAMPEVLAAVERTGMEHWFAVSVKAPPSEKQTSSPPLTWRILWDASGSRSAADVAAARGVVEKLPENACYELIEFRNVPEKPFVCATRAELLSRLSRVAYDGGTDLAALAAAHRTNATQNATLLFTDGIDALSEGVPDFGPQKPTALVFGAARDVEMLRRACGGRVVDLALRTPAEALDFILSPPPLVEGLSGDGVANVQGVGLPAEGRVTILGRLVADSAEVRIDFGHGRQSAPISLSAADAREGRLLATAWAARRVNELSPRADDHSDELLAIGRRYGIASPATSLIVFESLSQWLEHDVEPPESLADIHAQWVKRRPTEAQRAEREENRRKSFLQRLRSEWKARIAWWENPIPPKPKTPKSGLFDSMRRRSAMGETAAMAANFSRAAAPARRAMVEAMEDAAPAEADRSADAPAGAVKSKAAFAQKRAASATISVKPWDPQTPYLVAIKDAKAALGPSGGTEYAEYLAQREKYASSPAFYLDCGGWFFKQNERSLAVRVLSNLAELKLDDPGLLRTCAWRLREAGEFDAAIAILRKVAKLRPEDPHSFRDLAIVFEGRGRRDMSAADISEALANYHKAAFTPWNKDNGLWTALVALEEMNALIAWSARQDWPDGKRPAPPEFDAVFARNLDLDVRIALSWDVDNTDIDLHVLEPDGEEAYYGHNRTSSGGLVSHDVTTGYGPEEYLKKDSAKGVYKILTHYYGSRQQTLVGPATVTATVFTNWGRPDEKCQTLSLRLDKPRDKVEIGAVTIE